MPRFTGHAPSPRSVFSPLPLSGAADNADNPGAVNA